MASALNGPTESWSFVSIFAEKGPMDSPIWRPSSPVQEEWQEEEDDRVYSCRIVSEETDMFNAKHYEIRWDDWHRSDGTNTTWTQSDTIPDIGLTAHRDDWDDKQRAKRVEVARQSQSIKVTLELGQVWHEDATVEIAHGYEECLQEKLRLGNIAAYRNWDSVPRLGHRDAEDNADVTGGDRSQTRSSESNHRPYRSRQTRSRSTRSSTPASEAQNKARPSLDRSMSGRDRRRQLQQAWTQIARRAGAAPISIVNEVNSEEVPDGLEEFQYIERHCVRSEEVQASLPADDGSACLVTCNCEDICNDATACGCQDPSELINDSDIKQFAYNKHGLFRFNLPSGVEVIECNKNCSCDLRTCPNRVAQLPRNVPIEVFRTANRGWGARATVDVAKGEVIGIYTGKVIFREDAAKFTGDRKSYIFDLDVRETGEVYPAESHYRYSVDAYRCGNWTRFVNHSCDANMCVFPVVWDTIPELYQPYLAFVARKNIPARTEFTIDYAPQEKNRKNKGKTKIPSDARPCMCGTDSCRGWVRV